MTIEERLRDRILQNFKSIRAFTKEIGLPYSTVDSMLRKGVGNSSYETVKRVCQGLGSDVSLLEQQANTFTEKVTGLISAAEKEHIKKYRALDRHGKKAVDCLLELEWKRICTQEQTEHTESLPFAARSGKASEGELIIRKRFRTDELEEEGTEF